MIEDTYQAILTQLPAGTDKVFRLGRYHLNTVYESPRIVMVPDTEVLERSNGERLEGRIEKPLARANVNYLFYVQGDSYSQVEDLVNTLLTAIKKSGLQSNFDGVRIEWHDEQGEMGQGVFCVVQNLVVPGAYVALATWATIEQIIQECTLEEG